MIVLNKKMHVVIKKKILLAIILHVLKKRVSCSLKKLIFDTTFFKLNNQTDDTCICIFFFTANAFLFRELEQRYNLIIL